MKPLYVVSTQAYAGKTGLCASVALAAADRGLQVGYMKPVGTLPVRVDGALVDQDCDSLHKILGLAGAVEDMSPVVLTPQFIHGQLARPRVNCRARVIEAFDEYSRGKDLVILEGMSHVHEGRWLGLAPRQVCRLLHAAAVLIVKFEHELVLDEILIANDILGGDLAGVILSWAPEAKLPLINDSIIPFLVDAGVAVLGVVPKDPGMLAVTVAELADELDGRILTAQDQRARYIESFMVGAMGQEKALTFFRQKSNKAVITGGDREDVQLAALETDTTALVLTGNQEPSDAVLRRADDTDVPIVVVDMDTMTAIERTDMMIGRIRVHDVTRVERMRELLSRTIDLDGIVDRLAE